MSTSLRLLAAQWRLENLEKRTLKVALGNGEDLNAVYAYRRLFLWYGGGKAYMPNPRSWAVREAVRGLGHLFATYSETPEADLPFAFSELPRPEGRPIVEAKIIFNSLDGPEGLTELLDYLDTLVSVANEGYATSIGLPAGVKRFDRDAIIRTALVWWDIQLINKGLLP